MKLSIRAISASLVLAVVFVVIAILLFGEEPTPESAGATLGNAASRPMDQLKANSLHEADNAESVTERVAADQAASSDAYSTVRVMDQDGRTVQSAEVVDAAGRVGLTDQYGSLRHAHASEVMLTVRKTGFLDSGVNIKVPGSTVTVTLCQVYGLQFAIQFSDGSSAQGVKCALVRSQDTDGPSWMSDQRETRGDGRVSFDELRRGRYQISIEDSRFVASSFSGTTRNGLTPVPTDEQILVTVSHLSAVCVQIVGDEVVSGYFRVGMAPAFAAHGAGNRALAAQKQTQRKHPAVLTRVWIAAKADQPVEWVGYLRFQGWTSVLATPRMWSETLEPEVRVVTPGPSDLTSLISVDWGGTKGPPLIARLQDMSHGMVSIAMHDSPTRVPAGVYSILPADPNLRRFLALDSEQAIDLSKPSSSWTVRATLREPLESVTCFPKYEADAGEAVALVGTMEILDGDEIVGQYYCNGSDPLQLWLPREKTFRCQCALRGLTGDRVISASASCSRVVDGVLALILK